ncbi:MAG: helix-turn-helix transcriptional regulator [Clostridia bacterium]|nr:helix-turn-helix transcriptional regulator [Clostridia bacterium]
MEHKMTQTTLASLLFMSQDTISLWERNKSLPDVKSVISMSKIFGVTTDYILGVEK